MPKKTISFGVEKFDTLKTHAETKACELGIDDARGGLIGMWDVIVHLLRNKGEQWNDPRAQAKSLQSKASTALNARLHDGTIELTDTQITYIARAFEFEDNIDVFLNGSVEEFETLLSGESSNGDKVLTLQPLSPSDPTKRRGATVYLEPLGQGHEMHGALSVEARARYYGDWVFAFSDLTIEIRFEEGKTINLKYPDGISRQDWQALGSHPCKLRFGGTPQLPTLELRAEGDRAIVLGPIIDQKEIGEFKEPVKGDIIRIRVMAHQHDAEIGQKLKDKDHGPICGEVAKNGTKADIIKTLLTAEDRKGQPNSLDPAEGGYILLDEIEVRVVEVSR